MDAAKLRGFTNASFRVSDSRTGFRYYVKQATCPTGTVSVNRSVTSTNSLGQVFVGARCPAGFSAFAGGAWYHDAGSQAPMRYGNLRASEMTSDDRGWFAGGDVFASGIELTAKVRCNDRLG